MERPSEDTLRELAYYEMLDKIDHIKKLIDLEWNGSITSSHCIKRINDILTEK